MLKKAALVHTVTTHQIQVAGYTLKGTVYRITKNPSDEPVPNNIRGNPPAPATPSAEKEI